MSWLPRHLPRKISLFLKCLHRATRRALRTHASAMCARCFPLHASRRRLSLLPRQGSAFLPLVPHALLRLRAKMTGLSSSADLAPSTMSRRPRSMVRSSDNHRHRPDVDSVHDSSIPSVCCAFHVCRSPMHQQSQPRTFLVPLLVQMHANSNTSE